MASFFTKFARGAATAGATLFRDQAMNQMKMDLAMKRDMMLEKNRATAVTKAQEFQSTESEMLRTGQTERQQTGIEASASEAALGRIASGERTQKTIEASASEAALNRIAADKRQQLTIAAQKETPQTKLAKLQLNAAKNVAQLKQAYANAPDDEARFEAAKSIMAELGRPIEANASKLRPMEADVLNMIKAGIIKTAKEGYEKLLNPDDSFGLLLRVMKSLQAKEEDVLLQKDKKGIRKILTEASGIVDDFLNKGGDIVTGLGTIRSADVTAAERAGQQVNNKTGEVVILRNNKWHKVI